MRRIARAEAFDEVSDHVHPRHIKARGINPISQLAAEVEGGR